LWVEDHAAAIDVIFHNGQLGETYNVGGLNEWSNIDLVHQLIILVDEKLGRQSGYSNKLIQFVKDRAGHDRRYAIDASKLERELNWRPSIRFEDGLKHTVDWYLTNEDWVRRVTTGAYQDYYNKQYDQR
jgi:dTDP-glucose 4,6-dehydratase